ncbi:MAG: hypothetical protein KQI78_03680 [Deltaproteobacteria bacterium]|nr:hypothetical protein [Deltaproteobacteria bacterium]
MQTENATFPGKICHEYGNAVKNQGNGKRSEDNFPCDYLHPYSDQAMKLHNTKVFNLCRIKKVGLEKWAKEEAGDILDKYYYGAWTL